MGLICLYKTCVLSFLNIIRNVICFMILVILLHFDMPQNFIFKISVPRLSSRGLKLNSSEGHIPKRDPCYIAYCHYYNIVHVNLFHSFSICFCFYCINNNLRKKSFDPFNFFPLNSFFTSLAPTTKKTSKRKKEV